MTPDPLHTDAYTVTVDGRDVAVHGARSCRAPWPFRCFKAGEHPGIKLASPDASGGPAQIAPAGNAPYAFTSFPAAGPARVTITSDRPLEKAQVRPAGAAVVVDASPHRLVLDIPGPSKLSVEPRGRHDGLLVFADPPETDVPDPGDPRVRAFGPGHHRVGVIELHDDETLYLAPGAVVEAAVRADRAHNIRILGRGILCGDPWGWRDGPQAHMVMLNECKDIRIEGITLRCSWQWTTRLFACRHARIRNVKLCCGKNLNDDGINPCSTQDVLIEDCFIRTQDDCVSIKGHHNDRRGCERITIRHCLLWSDLSRVVMVGPESHANRIGDIHMHDCDVLHLGPPVNKARFGDWDGCAPAFCVQAGEDCLMEHLRFENLRVHVEPERDGKDVILLEPTVNAFMKRRTMGNIRDVHFNDIAFLGEDCRPTIRMWGKDAKHSVERIRFRNVTLSGRALDRDYPGLTVGPHTRDIAFT